MSTIVKLVQGSAEWHEHRRTHRNASETPVVLGVSPWTTPYQLWQQKLGLIAPGVTPAMLHGTQLEPAARAAYENLTGLTMQPLVLVDGDYSASLDGLTLAGDRLVEIKCPVKGRDSTLWQSIAARRLPEYYLWQVQHQLMVTGADIADVYVFDGSDGLVLPVAPEPERWSQLRTAWDSFAEFVARAEPPPLSSRDVRVREDPEWLRAAAAYLEAKHAADAVGAVLDDAKAQLLRLANHAREEGGGVAVTRFFKRGNIEYKRIPALEGIDLEQFRGAGREEVRVTMAT